MRWFDNSLSFVVIFKKEIVFIMLLFMNVFLVFQKNGERFEKPLGLISSRQLWRRILKRGGKKIDLQLSKYFFVILHGISATKNSKENQLQQLNSKAE